MFETPRWLMVSVFIDEYLTPGTCSSVFEFVEVLGRTIEFDLVSSSCLTKNSIAGSLGWECKGW